MLRSGPQLQSSNVDSNDRNVQLFLQPLCQRHLCSQVILLQGSVAFLWKVKRCETCVRTLCTKWGKLPWTDWYRTGQWHPWPRAGRISPKAQNPVTVPLPRKRRANKGRGCIRKVASCSRKLRVVFGNLCSKYVTCIRVWKVVFGNWRVVCGKWYSQTRYRGFGNREQTWPQSWNPFFPDCFSAQKMVPCQQQQLEDKLKLISRSIRWSAGVVDWSLMNMSKLISHSIYCLEGVVDLIRYEDRLKVLSYNIPFNTSSTAQGGGGSFKNRKPIGEVGCCESGMAERSHWWTERWLMSPLFLSISLTIYLPTHLPIYLPMYLSIYLSIYLSFYLSICLSIHLTIYLSTVSLSLFHLSSCLPVYLSIYLSICLCIYLSIYLSLSLSLSSVYLSSCLPVYLSMFLSICLSVYLSICGAMSFSVM